MKRITIADLVTRLQQLTPAQVELSAVQALIADGDLDEASLRPFIQPRADKYARHLVHRSDLFEVMVLTWLPGQVTPIHNHAGNCGWMRLVRGRLCEETFQLLPSTEANGLEVAADVAAVRCGVNLQGLDRRTVAEIGAVATVDRERAIHRIGNPRDGAGTETMVTLHVYSRPHDTCLVFDAEARTCGRRELKFDNAAAAD